MPGEPVVVRLGRIERFDKVASGVPVSPPGGTPQCWFVRGRNFAATDRDCFRASAWLVGCTCCDRERGRRDVVIRRVRARHFHADDPGRVTSGVFDDAFGDGGAAEAKVPGGGLGAVRDHRVRNAFVVAFL